MVANAMSFQLDAGQQNYGIKLDVFEGPLDLLLFLIRKDEVDIYDIPIASITKQFLEYVELIEGLDLEQAGDFVLMAATLMKIKSRMLLPIDPEDEDEAEDPREELVRRLLEYQQYKEVATWLEDEQESHRDIFYRGASLDMDGIQDEEDPLAAYRSVGLFDLMAAFRNALVDAPKIDYHEVGREEVTAEERAEVILEALREQGGQVSFYKLVSGLPKLMLIVTFVALLELIKSGKAQIRQATSESDIWIYEDTTEDALPDEQTESGSEHHV
jgi:segregation and condensation protein A